MDEKAFLNNVRQGAMLALGEYRSSKAEILNWRDKNTGRAMSAPILRHNVEFGSVAVSVSERVPEGTRIEDIHVPYKKGEVVVLWVEELSRNLGLVSARGRLEHYSPAPSPGKGSPVGGALASASSG